MKPNPKVPQLWVRTNNNYGAPGVDLRIVYPSGYVESNTPMLGWDESFLSNSSYKEAVAELVDYGHTFVFNIE